MYALFWTPEVAPFKWQKQIISFMKAVGTKSVRKDSFEAFMIICTVLSQGI